MGDMKLTKKNPPTDPSTPGVNVADLLGLRDGHLVGFYKSRGQSAWILQ